MGLKTRTEMRDEVISMLGGVTNLDTYIDDKLFTSLQDLCTYYRFYELEKNTTITLLTGDCTVAVPTDMLSPQNIEWLDTSTRWPLYIKDFTYVRNMYMPGISSRPTYISRHGNLFYVDRDADQDYSFTLFYKYRPVDFASGTAVTPIGEEWDWALILNTTAIGWLRLRNVELYKELRQEYVSYVRGRMPEKDEMAERWNEAIVEDWDGPVEQGW